MSIKRQFGSSVAWMAAGNWIEQALNFSVFILLARLLGAEAFGFLAMAAAIVILAEFLVRESLTEYLITAEQPSAGHHNAAFWSLLGLGAALTVWLIALSGLVATFYGQAQVRDLMQALSATVLLVAVGAVPVAMLRRSLKFRSLAVRAVCGVVAGGVVAVWMALHGYGVWSLVAQRLVQVSTNTVLAWLAVSWRPGLAGSRREYKDILGFGSTVLGLRAAQVARIQVPMVIIGATLGPVTLGLFSLAWRLVEIASFLVMTPIRMVSQPAFAALSRQGHKATDLLVDISRLSGLAAFPAFVGLALLSQPVLALMFGEQWLGAAPILSIIAVVGIYLSIEMVHQSFCLAAGRARAVAVIAWLEVAFGAGLIWGLAGLGVGAMSWAFVASFLALWIVRYRIVSQIGAVDVRSLLMIQLAPFIGALMMAVGVIAVRHLTSALPDLAVVVLASLTGAGIFAVFTRLFMRDRIQLLQSFAAPMGDADVLD